MNKNILHNYQTMPWKNGQGTTRQFIISPSNCTVSDDFTFRLSSAQMKTQFNNITNNSSSSTLSTTGTTTTGTENSQIVPFSSFVGYSRVLIYTKCCQVDSQQKSKNPTQMFILQEEQDKVMRDYLPMMVPYSFSGSTQTKCELSSPSMEEEHLIIDFNVMTRDGKAKCEKVACHAISMESPLEINLLDLLYSSPLNETSSTTNESSTQLKELNKSNHESIESNQDKWYFFLYIPDDLGATTRVTIPTLPSFEIKRDETLQLDGIGDYAQILSQAIISFEPNKEQDGRHVIGVLIIENCK